MRTSYRRARFNVYQDKVYRAFGLQRMSGGNSRAKLGQEEITTVPDWVTSSPRAVSSEQGPSWSQQYRVEPRPSGKMGGGLHHFIRPWPIRRQEWQTALFVATRRSRTSPRTTGGFAA